MSLKDKFESLYNKGVDYFVSGKYEKAVDCFKSALKIDDTRPQVYYNLGLCYQSLNNFEEAIVNYQLVLNLFYEDSDTYYNLALIYHNLSRYTEAIEYYQKSLEISRESDTLFSLALLYFELEEYDKALKYALQSIEKEPDASYFVKFIQIIRNKTVDEDKINLSVYILKAYLECLNLKPRDYDLLIGLSLVYSKCEKISEAKKYCEQALDLNPKSFEANNQFGLILYCENNYKDAVKYFKKAFELDTVGNPQIYLNLAFAYEKTNDFHQAVKYFEILLLKFQDFEFIEFIKKHLIELKAQIKKIENDND